jgi:hypothetical protein
MHTMLSARDVPMYLVAIKSFLRFYRSVAVVVHSDGSLEQHHEDRILRHVPGVEIIRFDAADELARQSVGKDSPIWRIRSIDVSYRRLIDSALWSRTSKRIIIDADTLVLHPPVEVIEWIERSYVPFLMGQPPRPRAGGEGPGSRGPKNVQTVFKENLEAIAAAMGQAPRFLDGSTGGFYGCAAEDLRIDRVESLIRTCTDLGVPMHQWGGEQCVVIYLLSAAGAVRLDPERYVNFYVDCVEKADRAAFLHFLGTYRFLGRLYPRLSARVVHDLARPRMAVSQ